mmetsp:Transcript_22678/g.57459  ORF Transcript_22678/g.57459 Transcript_22678/m.57459 type:complete len:427 (-) Transcript_22678:402-1682(-)
MMIEQRRSTSAQRRIPLSERAEDPRVLLLLSTTGAAAAILILSLFVTDEGPLREIRLSWTNSRFVSGADDDQSINRCLRRSSLGRVLVAAIGGGVRLLGVGLRVFLLVIRLGHDRGEAQLCGAQVRHQNWHRGFLLHAVTNVDVVDVAALAHRESAGPALALDDRYRVLLRHVVECVAALVPDLLHGPGEAVSVVVLVKVALDWREHWYWWALFHLRVKRGLRVLVHRLLCLAVGITRLTIFENVVPAVHPGALCAQFLYGWHCEILGFYELPALFVDGVESVDVQRAAVRDARDLGSEEVDFLPPEPGTRDDVLVQVPGEVLLQNTGLRYLCGRHLRQLRQRAQRLVLDEVGEFVCADTARFVGVGPDPLPRDGCLVYQVVLLRTQNLAPKPDALHACLLCDFGYSERNLVALLLAKTKPGPSEC